MSTKVTITNFRSIRSMSFEFEGYATILGDNFIGKSAILDAIDAALNNKSGTDFITWGEKFSEVRIQREGFDLLWHKEEGNNHYLINGKPYDKINNDLPAVISESGFGEVEVSGEKINLTYCRQNNPLFLVDARKKGYTTDLLASIYSIDTAYKADRLCRKDLKNTNSKVKLRDTDRVLAEEEVKKLEPIQEVEKGVSKLKIKRNNLKKKADTIEAMEENLVKFKETSGVCIRLKKVPSIEEPDNSGLSSLSEEVRKLESLYKRLTDSSAPIRRLKPIADVKEISDGSGLKDLKNEIVMMGDLLSKLQRANSTLDSLEGVNDLKSPKDPGLNFDSLNELMDLHSDLQAKAKEVKTCKSYIEDIEKDLESIEEELSTFDKCPTCGGELHGQH